VYGTSGRFFANMGGTTGVNALVPDFFRGKSFFYFPNEIQLRSDDDDRVRAAMARILFIQTLS